MAKAFSKRIKEIMDGVKKAKNGKVNPSFSRKFYDDVAGAILNDPDYETTEFKVRNGKPTEIKSKPSRAFREKLLLPIAKGFGVDEADANKFCENYKFTPTQANTIYDLMSAINWEYMNCGKILRLPSKKDFTGSIFIKDVPESTFVQPKTGKKTKSKAHRALGKKSSTPAWCKESVK